MVAEKSDENHMVCAQINEEHFIYSRFIPSCNLQRNEKIFPSINRKRKPQIIAMILKFQLRFQKTELF